MLGRVGRGEYAIDVIEYGGNSRKKNARANLRQSANENVDDLELFISKTIERFKKLIVFHFSFKAVY